MRSMKLICICMVILFGVFLVGCRDRPRQGHIIAKTKEILRGTCKIIWLAEEESGQHPPTVLSELVSWLLNNGADPQYDDYIDARAKVILDSWGNPIVLVLQHGKLTAVGSKGPDGRWDGGTGDDIVVGLGEVRK